jgi:hypothetical protein
VNISHLRFFIAIPLTLFCFSALGKDKHAQNTGSDQDHIDVVAHLPLTGGAVTGFLETQHYRRNYLYAQHDAGKTLSLIDITSTAQPALLAEIPSESLVSTQPSSAPALAPSTFRIMSFADPLHPSVKQEFARVTAIARDQKRGLIFLANDVGVWILQQKYAQDPEAEKEWEHMMLDNR